MSDTAPATPALQLVAPDRLAIAGPVTFATASGLLRDSMGLFAGRQAMTVDMAGVTSVDSAGLALLLEWLRLATTERRALHFTSLPEKLVAIARLSGVEDMLGGGYSPPESSSSRSSR